MNVSHVRGFWIHNFTPLSFETNHAHQCGWVTPLLSLWPVGSQGWPLLIFSQFGCKYFYFSFSIFYRSEKCPKSSYFPGVRAMESLLQHCAWSWKKYVPTHFLLYITIFSFKRWLTDQLSTVFFGSLGWHDVASEQVPVRETRLVLAIVLHQIVGTSCKMGVQKG